MKKIIISFVSVIILFSLTTLVHAQQQVEALDASPSPTVQYRLPYPGMLPDNAFYKFKVLRDKIMLSLIQDPDKKAQYYLLLANKQLLMSKMLVDKGNITLARETALKGENQMTLMTFTFKNANRAPKADFLNEVRLATLKHQELLKDIVAKVPAEEAPIFSNVLEFSQRNMDQLQYLSTGATE